MTRVERCQREIALVEGLLRSGHPDLDGLILALVDWRTELRLIRAEEEAGDGSTAESNSADSLRNEKMSGELHESNDLGASDGSAR